MTTDEQFRQRTLADKINYLYHTIHPSGRGEYSNEEVATAIRTSGGPTISATYLWQLRKGIRDNPTKKHLEALADFFGVSPAYFFDEEAAARIDAELKLLVALRDSRVREIALRAFGLSPEFLSSVAEMIQRARHLAQLPDVEDPLADSGATRRGEAKPTDDVEASRNSVSVDRAAEEETTSPDSEAT